MLKGTTKIELTDVHTGEKQVVEKHNMVTNAVNEIFQPVCGHCTNETQLQGYIPAYSTLLGGLLLFDSALDEDVDNILAGADVEIVGCARYNDVGTSASVRRGSYNIAESQWDAANRRMKYVYDFATSQGNGTIASVCLTHVDAGYGTYGSDYQYTTPIAGNHWTVPQSFLVDGKSRYSSGIVAGGEYLFLLDPDNDVAYYFKVTDSTHLAITKRRMGLKNISLFLADHVLLSSDTLATLSTGIHLGAYHATYNYDYADNALYILSSTSSSIPVNGTVVVTKIAFGTWDVTQTTITNVSTRAWRTLSTGSGYTSAIVHDGYMYIRSDTSTSTSTVYFYKVQLSNPANIVLLSGTAGTYDVYPKLAYNGLVYCDYHSNSSSSSTTMRMYLADGVNNKVRFSGNGCIYNGYYTSYIPIKDHPMLFYRTTDDGGGFIYLKNYLATINNLTEPVTKTADKTMKITYTIEES